jgi:hypothetical protein
LKEVIVFLVLALIAYGFRRLFIWAGKDDFIDAKETTAVITSIVSSEHENIQYYVYFATDDGRYIKGQSIHYSPRKLKYKKDDTVRIKYIIIRDNRALVSIVDEELIPIRNSSKKSARNCLIACVVFIIIAEILFLKHNIVYNNYK